MKNLLTISLPVLLAFSYWYIVATPWYCSSLKCCIHQDANACPKVQTRGLVEARFQPVVDLLEDSLTIGWDLGASLYVELDGQPVIDVVGGYADLERTTLMDPDMVNLIMSNGKTFETIGIALLVDRGLLDLTAPIANYWPEFGQRGKETISIQDILSHRAGGSYAFEVEPSVETLQDTTRRDAFLASQPFLYPKGTVFYRGWHSSFYSDAICRRVDPKKRSLQQLVQQDVFDPLEETLVCPPISDDLAQKQKVPVKVNPVFGLSPARLLLGILPQLFLPVSIPKLVGLDDRMILGKDQRDLLAGLIRLQNTDWIGLKKTIPCAPQAAEDFNNRECFLSFSMMSSNCMANGRGATRAMASFFEADSNLVSKETRALFLQPLPEAKDLLLNVNYNHTTGGFARNLFHRPETKGCIGWFGLGGSTVQHCTIVGTSNHTIAFGYVPNSFSPKLFVDRAQTLLSAAAAITATL